MIPRLDDVARDAALLDALAAGEPTDDPTVALLWALREPPVLKVRRRAHKRVGVVLTAMLLSSSIGVAAAATTSHPGDLLYPVHRVVLGRTADDPAPVRALLEQAKRAVRTTPLDPTTRAHALALATQVEQHLPALHDSDAQPLRAGVDEVRTMATAAPTRHARHHRHHHLLAHRVHLTR